MYIGLGSEGHGDDGGMVGYRGIGPLERIGASGLWKGVALESKGRPLDRE